MNRTYQIVTHEESGKKVWPMIVMTATRGITEVTQSTLEDAKRWALCNSVNYPNQAFIVERDGQETVRFYQGQAIVREVK